MTTLFPLPITSLPQADLHIEGAIAYLSQSETHQVLYATFSQDATLSERTHQGQFSYVLEGRIDLCIEGVTTTYSKGDRFHIPPDTPHAAHIYAGYADISLFNQPDRYESKGKETEQGIVPPVR